MLERQGRDEGSLVLTQINAHAPRNDVDIVGSCCSLREQVCGGSIGEEQSHEQLLDRRPQRADHLFGV